MTGFERVFFDSSPFIYLVENHPKYYLPVASYIIDLTESNTPLITSVLTVAEVYVKPYRDNDLKLLKDFDDTLKVLNFAIIDIDFKIADLSATLRAKYPFLKGIDSLQLATAITQSSQKFLTNDKKLSQITEIEITLIEKLLLT